MSMVPEGTVISFIAERDLASEDLRILIRKLGRVGLVTDFEFSAAKAPDIIYDENEQPYVGLAHFNHFAITHSLSARRTSTVWGAITGAFREFRKHQRYENSPDYGYRQWLNSGLVAMVNPNWETEHPYDSSGLDNNFVVSMSSLREAVNSGSITALYNMAGSGSILLAKFLDSLDS